MKKILLSVIVSVCLLFGLTVVSSAQGAKTVKAIEVQGNKTISLATILSKIKTRVGQEYLQSVISDDLKRLYNTGYFADVRVDREEYQSGFKVVIFLDEKPIIEEITFSKTKYYNSKALEKKINSKVGTFLDNKVLKDDIKTIEELLSKKGLSTAEVEVETFTDDVTNKVSLHFILREGYKVTIKNIDVTGNYSFSDKKILKIMKTKDKGILNKGFLKDDVLDEDMSRIISFYSQNGYIDATLEYEVEYLVKGKVEIHVQIDEGKRYSVGTLDIMGNAIVSLKEIKNIMNEIQEGNIFSDEKLAVDVSNIRTLYFDKGYIFANIKESTSLDSETGLVDIKFEITEGDVAYIQQVNVQGNTRTRDIVIRRELRLNPGDRFDGSKLRRSKERLNRLGYFEEVNFDIGDTNIYDQKDLVVQVKEAKTGSFSFGGGYSTVDNIVGFVEIEQRNFDFANWPTFTGGGQNLQLRAETGSTKNNVTLSFTEPWLFDNPVSGGFDLFLTERDREEDTGYAYDEKRAGGVLRFGKQLTEYTTGRISYRNEEITIGNFEDDVSADLRAEEGKNRVSMIGTGLIFDGRDSSFSPTKGLYASIGYDIAGGPLGGDKDFWRIDTKTSYYIPLKFKSVLEFSFRAGIVEAYDTTAAVPIFERFFAGGARSIRGYEERRVSPLDSYSSSGDPVGGEGILVANIEYTIPVIEFIKLAAFFDAGQILSEKVDHSETIQMGAGLGLRIKTPIGPINLDYAYPLNPIDTIHEDGGQLYFSVSRGF